MIIYITGCLGFIGSHVTKACLDKGWYVYGIDKCTYKTLIYFKRKIIGLYYADGLCKYVESENYERDNIVNIIEENMKEKLS